MPGSLSRSRFALDGPHDGFQDLCRLLQGRLGLCIQLSDSFGECADAALATFDQELFACRCGGEVRAAGIARILRPGDQALFFEGTDNSGHGWRAHLFGGGKVAKGNRPSENYDRERGKAWRVEAAALILSTQLAQEMNSERVELVSDIFRIWHHFFWHRAEFSC
jgi:hypothetical protein